MSTPEDTAGASFSNRAVDAAIKIGLAALLIYWCYDIIRPFAVILIWAGILAVAFLPLCDRVSRWFGGRRKTAVALLALLSILLLLGPVGYFATKLSQDAQFYLGGLKEGHIMVPPPADSVRDWPIVGEALHEFWLLASTNITAALATVKPQLQAAGEAALGSAARGGLAVLQFLAALVIAGVLMVRPENGRAMVDKFATRVVGPRAATIIDGVKATIMSVSKGVLGTSAIQTVFIAIGMIAAGLPGAGVWIMLCLILSVAQVGAGLIVIPTMIYMFMEASTTAAVLYLIYMIPVMLIDNVLKPILMGRGSDIPVIVIFLGVIGGTIAYGLIGVFVGPVVLAVGYNMFMVWVNREQSDV